MTKIAIKFGDNDFHQTFRNVLKMLGRALKDGRTLTKDQVLRSANSVSYECYLLFQNDWDSTEKLAENKEHMIEYLTLKEENILMDEEVDRYMAETDGNHSTWILEYDSHLDNVTIYSW